MLLKLTCKAAFAKSRVVAACSCRGKHLRALLKAFRSGGALNSFEGSMHARPSDAYGGRSPSIFSNMSSFNGAAYERSSRASSVNRPLSEAGTAAVAPEELIAAAPELHATSSTRDRSQLSIISSMRPAGGEGASSVQGLPVRIGHQQQMSWGDVPDVASLGLYPSSDVGTSIALSLRDRISSDLLTAEPSMISNSSFRHVAAHRATRDTDGSYQGSALASTHAPVDTGCLQTHLLDTVNTDGLDINSYGSVVINESAACASILRASSLLTSSSAADAPTAEPVAAAMGTRAGEPVGEADEGREEGEKKMNNSVSFRVQQQAEKSAHHRHKSSNYSRLLDVRVDDWCAAWWPPDAWP